MNILLDAQRFTTSQPATTLADVVDQARDQAAKNDRVIASIVCDGQDLSHDDLEARLAAPADAVQQIELTTCLPGELVADALTHALTLLDETEQQREQVVEWLAQGDTKKSNEGLIGCFQNWARIHAAIVQGMAMLRLDVETLEVGGESVESMLGEITNQLKQVKEVLLSGDQVLLADLLQYEFEEATNRWRRAIEAIQACALTSSSTR